MRTTWMSLPILAGLSLVTACGSNDSSTSESPAGPGARPSAPAGEMKAANAKQMAGDDGSASKLNAKMNPFEKASTEQEQPSLSGLHFASHAQMRQFAEAQRVVGDEADECKPTESGDKTDADKDEVPLNSTQTYNCNFDSGGNEMFKLKMSITGAIGVADEDDTKVFPAKGATWTFNNFNYSVAMNFAGQEGQGEAVNFSINSVMNGTHKMTVDADMKSTLEMNMQSAIKNSGTGGQAAAGETEGAQNLDITTNEWVTVTVTPDDKADVTKSGAMTIDGYIGLVSTESMNLKISSTDLKYGCPKVYILEDEPLNYIKSGTITYEDAKANKLTFTWTNCEQKPKATFNGEAI